MFYIKKGVVNEKSIDVFKKILDNNAYSRSLCTLVRICNKSPDAGPHNAGSVVDALPKSPWLLVKTVNKYWEDKRSDMVVNKVEYPW